MLRFTISNKNISDSRRQILVRLWQFDKTNSQLSSTKCRKPELKWRISFFHPELISRKFPKPFSVPTFSDQTEIPAKEDFLSTELSVRLRIRKLRIFSTFSRKPMDFYTCHCVRRGRLKMTSHIVWYFDPLFICQAFKN